MPEYVLQPPAARDHAAAPALDAEQRAVVEHGATPGRGPLLVLAGPGTGKTTTVVETVVERIEQEALSPDQVLVLTFSRKAADEVRGRIARRLARTTATTPAMTFHAFCYALLRHEQASDAYTNPMRLLSAPEQDAAIAELLHGANPQTWPDALRPGLRTRGMATELQRLMASARGQGMDAADVERLGERLGRDDWAAAGRFFDEYTAVAALQNTIDHTDMIFQAVRLLGDPELRDRWRKRFSLVVVDEYQDTDPLQVQLLSALAGDGRDLVAVGDPYQSIYTFRGANVDGILDFCAEFGSGDSDAPQVVLRNTHRYGERIAAAVRSIVHGRGALARVDGPVYEPLRTLISQVDEPGIVEVQTYATAAAEAAHIALRLREAHLHDELAWSEMAVLVRSGARLGRLQRALAAAGVPVEVAGDDVPLALEPAVRALLAALHAADDLHAGRPIDPDAANALLTGPLGGLDAASMRLLGRALRSDQGGTRPSRLLVAEALGDVRDLVPAPSATPTSQAVEACRRLGALLRSAADQIAAGEPAEQVLWTLWDGSNWPQRLMARAESTSDMALQANHDLDALCALFAEAARAEEQAAERSVTEMVAALEAQQIPADTLAQRGIGHSAVQLMTAHRSKGLEWPLVVVAGVQDGEWPDTRLRSSLLQVERLTPDRVAEPVTARELVAEERRLFYVACSRAQRHLLVTAIHAATEEGDQPSRFVAEMYAHVTGSRERTLPETRLERPQRGMSLRAAIAELRLLGESTDDPTVRHRAAANLARLASHPAGRTADPGRWWGLRELSQSEQPLRDPEVRLRLSGSQVSTVVSCPLHWFFDHEARGGQGSTSAQGFGKIVHALAAEVVNSSLDPDPVALAAHLDEVWDQLPFEAAWIGRRERAAAVQAIIRFCAWHAANGRQAIEAEREFTVEHDVDGHAVLLNGIFDRVELGDDGVHVVDLKTSKTKPTGAEVAEHAQLGFYQVAIDLGATAEVTGDARSAGAELVMLRIPESRAQPDQPYTRAQDAPRPDEVFFGVEHLQRTVRIMTDEALVATESKEACKYCTFQMVCPAKDEGRTILGDGA